MSILVINCGSTSIKAAVIEPDSGERLAELKIQRLSSDSANANLNGEAAAPCPDTHADALAEWLPRLIEAASGDVVAVGHRVVHGGERFQAPTLLDAEAVAQLEELTPLAPLHNPANVAGIRAAQSLLSEQPHVAVFDTAFHSTLSNRVKLYALPRELAEKHGVRRYGFHGTSHQFVAERAAKYLKEDLRNLRIITCHLGGGCSVCAVEYGRSVETSMGMTPLEGLVMGTRAGDIDSGVLFHLAREENLSIDQLDELLNRQSGLAGLSGIGNDLRDIEQRAEEGDEACRQAIQVFCHRVRKYIGAYAAVMGGVDAIVFTAGIGENSATVRHRIAQRLEFLGARMDETRNREQRPTADAPVAELSPSHSRVRLLAVATDESLAIARATAKCCQSSQLSERTIPVAISARHVHLTQEAVEALFGPGHELTPGKLLSQPGQFACEETVILHGPKRKLERVRVLGPTRSKNQVEIARTDEFFLGMDAPVRRSGDVKNSPGITLEGTEGRTFELDCGVICAWRHIHMTTADAEHFGVTDGDVVEVRVGKEGVRSLTFGDVLVRVKDSYALEMHIDTDEGNAAELESRDEGELAGTDGTATLTKRGS